MRAMAFTGIPRDALVFYEQLEADNSKSFWEANRNRFKEVVRGPVEQLAAELSDYGDFHVFRPHNDLRFSKNKPPYKTHQGAYTESEGGAGFYVQLSASGLMCGVGYYAMAKDQLERFRTAVAADATGGEIDAIVAALAKRGYTVGAIDALKTAPRGYPKDHPRIELLRRKGLMVSKEFGAPKWLHTRQVVSKVRQAWDGAAEMNAWLDTHVGPSTLEPDGFFG
jgi:TIGR02453 family protein